MADLPLEYVHRPPDGVDGVDGDAPLVVVLHGRGADERDLLPVAEELPGEYRVLSLRAPDRLSGGYTWYEIDASDGLENSQPHPEEFRRSLDLIAETVDAAADHWAVDEERIGLLGFSQGAISALGLLIEAPTRWAWVAAHHGYLAATHADRDPDGIAGTPVFVAAGDVDRIIPASRGAAAADRLRALDADVSFDRYPTGHGIGREELSDLTAFVSGG